MRSDIWLKILERLSLELAPQQFNTWVRPLQADFAVDNSNKVVCTLFAPNRFVRDWIGKKFLGRIEELFQEFITDQQVIVELSIGENRLGIRPLGGSSPSRAPGAITESQAARSPEYQAAADDRRRVDNDPQRSSRRDPSQEQQVANLLSGSGVAQKEVYSSDNVSSLSRFSEPERQAFAGHSDHSGQGQIPINPEYSHRDITDSQDQHFHVPYGRASDNRVNASSETTAADFDGPVSLSKNGNLHSSRPHDRHGLTARRDGVGSTAPRRSPRSSETVMERGQPVPASKKNAAGGATPRDVDLGGTVKHKSNLNTAFTFDSFVEGKSNQLARAAAMQVADNPGGAYNPLFLYGGVGLGKTHLMHAIGNQIMERRPNAKVVYLHSERFVADMVKALQINAINEFKRFYRTVDALLIDDIQFFAGKDRSQEEFFHTFNALLEGGQQMILTSDRYPKEITDVEERLKSRFGWGLTVAVEPPELETRVAILMKKAEETRIHLPHEAAFFIAKRIRSNVRELEGALKRVVANAHFTGQSISLEFVRESLKDLLAIQDKQVSVDNIQKTVADYFKIKVADVLSKRRSRSVARPRQVAMALAKELTNHSLPEIGEAFGGRDHTTVLHACRKIKDLCEEDSDLKDDYTKLLQMLTG